jgi:hypothetical protein
MWSLFIHRFVIHSLTHLFVSNMLSMHDNICTKCMNLWMNELHMISNTKSLEVKFEMHSQSRLDNLNVLIMIYKKLLDDTCVDYLFIKECVTNFIFLKMHYLFNTWRIFKNKGILGMITPWPMQYHSCLYLVLQ